MKIGDVVWVVKLRDGHLAWSKDGDGLDVSSTKEEALQDAHPKAEAVAVRLVPVPPQKEPSDG